MGNTIKKVGKAILAIIILAYAFIAILLTLCLFNLNKQGLAEFELTTVIPLEENYSSEYKKGDLVIVSKQSRSKSDVKIGDGIFYYAPESNLSVEYGKVSKVIDEGKNDQTYVIGKGYNVNFVYFIGNRITKLSGLGKAYNVLTSQFGYLALVILPTLVAVVVEIYAVIMEIIALRNEANYERIRREEAYREKIRREEEAKHANEKED